MLIGLGPEMFSGFAPGGGGGGTHSLSTVALAPPPSATQTVPSHLTPPSRLFSTGSARLVSVVPAVAPAGAPPAAPSIFRQLTTAEVLTPRARAAVTRQPSIFHGAAPGTPEYQAAIDSHARAEAARVIIAPTAPVGGVAPTPDGVVPSSGGGGGGGFAPTGGDAAPAPAPAVDHTWWWVAGIAGALGLAFVVSRRG